MCIRDRNRPHTAVTVAVPPVTGRGGWETAPTATTILVLPTSGSTPRKGAKKGTTPHQTLAQAKVGAQNKVKQARRALLELERRHERAADKVELLSRRKKALELELGDAEAERDRTASRMSATKSALDAAEKRLLTLEQETNK